MPSDVHGFFVKSRCCVAGLLLLAAVLSTRAGAQSVDGLSPFFRNVLADVAAAGRVSRLDSAALASGVRREVRIYTGFGMGTPSHVVRLWQDDDRAVHGRFGLLWGSGPPRATLPPKEERVLREQERAASAPVTAWVDSVYGCRATTQVRTMNVCWLGERPGRVAWTDLLERLDSLGVDSVRPPVNPKQGTDGWMIIVETRSRAGYRAYSYWMPDSASTDPGERAAARAAAVVRNAFARRVGR